MDNNSGFWIPADFRDEIIIAHRGESFDAPENTLASVNLAWDRKVKAVEIDIHLTKDFEIIVIHDKNTQRISGERKIVAKSSFEELRLLDAGSYKDIKWTNERIPLLKEVLKTVPLDGKLIIELKSDKRILRKLKQELSQSGLKNSQIEIIAFNKDLLQLAKNEMPNYKMLLLLNLDFLWPWWIYRVDEYKIIKKVKKLKFDGVDVWAGRLLSKGFIDKFKNAGLLVYTWTVNDKYKAQQLIESGVDGITTDRASWLTDELMRQDLH